MTLTRHGRRALRRAALTALRTNYRARGWTDQAMIQPGVTVLLLHNSGPADLSRLLRFVDARRELVVGFGEAMEALAAGRVERPMLALSFDDGFISNLRAASALTDRGVDACLYVPTDVIGLPKDRVDAFFRRTQAEGVMSWSDLESLRNAGHEVGSHCRQHLPLAEMSVSEAEDQIKGSVATLRERLGPTRHFAWPFGSLAHAPVPDVLRWCKEIDVLAASGVRGRNTEELLRRRGYLSRDAVDLRHLEADVDVFVTRSYRRLAGGEADASARR